MALITGKQKSQALNIARDVAAMGVNGVLASAGREIGSIIGFFVSPMIAGTSDGKTFNRMLSLLLLTDSLIERFVGGRGVVG